MGTTVIEEGRALAAPAGSSRLTMARVLVPVYAALAGALTWPLAAHLTGSLPYGVEPVGTVGLFNLWTLRWNQDRIGGLFRRYWDAPIFHPTDGTFALSEPQPLTGLAFAPVSWVTGNPVLAANLVLLTVLTANGWAAARLARRLGAAPAPALLAGALAVGLPFVASEMGVFQLTVVFPLFLLVDAVVRWASGGGRRAGAAMGLWLAATFLTCGYYGLFAVVGIGMPALVLARRDWLGRDRLLDVAAATAAFAVLALPVLVTQARITGEYTRSEDLVRGLSARTDDFWQLVPEAKGAGVAPWLRDHVSGQALYPGTALLALGVAGVLLAYRSRQRPEAGDPEPRDEPTGAEAGGADRWRVVLFLIAGACLARVLSFGLNLSVGGVGPYRIVRAVVPGFASLRSPFRFTVLTEVFLVALAAYALDALWRWRPRGRGVAVPWGPLAAVVVVAAGVVEVSIAPVRLFTVDRATPDWAAWLAEHPHRDDETGDGAVAFVPFPADNSVTSYEETTRQMLQSLDAGAATVNGYSGLFPASYDELELAMRSYPSDTAEALLREHGVSYLVVDLDWLGENPSRRLWVAQRYRVAFEGRGATVYEVA